MDMDVRSKDREATFEKGVLLITRTFDAPREVVFRSWVTPSYFASWFGPKECTVPHCSMDVRVGGSFLFCVRVPGDDIWAKGIYRELRAPEKLVFDSFFSDQKGNRVERPGFPKETRIAVTFEDVGGRTKVTIRQTGLERDQGEMKGWNEGLDRLAEYIGNSGRTAFERISDRQWAMTRTFAAPRALVFRAWTDPKHLAQWWGPKGFTNPVCEMDPKAGGAYRITMRSPDGQEYPMHGTLVEVKAPERLVFTIDTGEHPESWQEEMRRAGAQDIKPGHPHIETAVTFEEVAGGTRVRIVSSFGSVADLEAHLKMGAFQGWAQSLDRLEDLVTKGART